MNRPIHNVALRVLTVFSLLLIAGCSGGAFDAPLANGAQFRKGPYLLYTGDSASMAILWQTDSTPKEAKVEWGRTELCDDGRAKVMESNGGAEGHQFSYTIASLPSATRTYYRVTVDGNVVTSSFMTAPESDATSVTFYGISDSYGHTDVHNALIADLLLDVGVDKNSRQTILLNSGSFVTYGLTESYWDEEYFDRGYANVLLMLQQIPVMGGIGIHETYMAPPADLSYEVAHAGELLKKYWPYTFFTNANHMYYSFDYGPLHVAVVDQYTADFGVGSQQYEWLSDDLASSTKPWKIVMMHEPAYSASSMVNVTALSGLVPLFEQLDIPLVIQGYNHYYSRSTVNGVEYLVLGGGGAELTGVDPSVSYVVTTSERYHYARFEIEGDEMSVTVIKNDGTVIESFKLSH